MSDTVTQRTALCEIKGDVAPMKRTMMMMTLVLGCCISSQSYGFDLLDRMLGIKGCGSASACCDSGCDTACCEAEPACGCEAPACCEPACGSEVACCAEPTCGAPACCEAPSCDTCCDPCAKKSCGGLLSKLFNCNKCNTGCDSCEPACGCEAPSCCAEPACGCEAPACEPACGCEVAAGCDCSAGAPVVPAAVLCEEVRWLVVQAVRSSAQKQLLRTSLRLRTSLWLRSRLLRCSCSDGSRSDAGTGCRSERQPDHQASRHSGQCGLRSLDERRRTELLQT